MEFKELLGYRDAFKQLTIILLVGLLSSLGLAGYLYFDLSKKLNAISETVYAIDLEGNMYKMQARQYTIEDYINEVKGGVKEFYEYSYQYRTGAEYDKNMERMLKVTGQCGQEIEADLIENNVRSLIVGKNFEFSIEITKVIVDESKSPITVQVEAIQTIRRKKGVLKRHMDGVMEVNQTAREFPTNSHGIKIENFRITNNKKI